MAEQEPKRPSTSQPPPRRDAPAKPAPRVDGEQPGRVGLNKRPPADQRRAAWLRRVATAEARKSRARRSRGESMFFGLGVMGMIGWAVVLPTVIGLIIGLWLDRAFPGSVPWTIAMLMAGLVLGVFNAWTWVDREQKRIIQDRSRHAEERKPEEEDDD